MENESPGVRGQSDQKMPSVLGATGGSQNENPHEDLEINVFSTCSIYCIKYIIWKQLKVPIQNQVLTSEKSNTFPNYAELRDILQLQDSRQNQHDGQVKLPTAQIFMSRLQTKNPIPAELNLIVLMQAQPLASSNPAGGSINAPNITQNQASESYVHQH